MRKFVILFNVIFLGALQVANAGTLGGWVTGGGSPMPIKGARVFCGEESQITNSSGYFGFNEGDCGNIHILHPSIGKVTKPAGWYSRFKVDPVHVRGAYLSYWGAGSTVVKERVFTAVESLDLNSIVVDVKGDTGHVAFTYEHTLVDESRANTQRTIKDVEAFLTAAKQHNLHVVARIVVFKDDLLAKIRPEWTVKNKNGGHYVDREGLMWIDPSIRESWSYSLDIAEEAARLGFDEIQVDYIRYPDSNNIKLTVPNTRDNRTEAINDYLKELVRRLSKYPVLVSADIFGYVAWNEGDLGIGQNLTGLSGTGIDYISLMLYPSTFQFGVGSFKPAAKFPYETVYLSQKKAIERSGLPGYRFRPWIQSFRDYAYDRRPYGLQEIRAQARASDDSGASGWMLWNASNRYPLPDRTE